MRVRVVCVCICVCLRVNVAILSAAGTDNFEASRPVLQAKDDD